MKKFFFMLIVIGGIAGYWFYTHNPSSSGPPPTEERLASIPDYAFSGELNDPTPQAHADFGSSISQIQDLNGDGNKDLLVAAEMQNLVKDLPHGQLFKLNGVDGTLMSPVELPLPKNKALFGPYCSQIGDVDGDTTQDLLVGAKVRFVARGGHVGGHVYLISGSDGSVIRKIGPPSDFSKKRKKGFVVTSVSQIEDITGDGVDDILAGSKFEDVGVMSDAGQVYIFRSSDGTLIRSIPHPSPTPEAGFGASVSQISDMNGDGVEDILVGAPLQTVEGTKAQGQVYVISTADGSLIRKINHPSPQKKAFFGSSVSQIDINGDGIDDILAGASNQHVTKNKLGQGKAYVISSTDGSVLKTIDHPKSPGAASFGSSITQFADQNGDGMEEIIVGADNHAVGGVVEGKSGQGQVYVFASKPAEG